MASWFILKGAVVFIIACGCLSTAERDILEKFKPSKNNPPELNEFLENVLKYKDDFKWIREIAESSLKNSKVLNGNEEKINYFSPYVKQRQKVRTNRYSRINQPSSNEIDPYDYDPPNNDAYPFHASNIDYNYEDQPVKRTRDAWRNIKRHKVSRKRRGLDLSDYNSNKDPGISEVRISPRSHSGVIEVPGNKYELLRKSDRNLVKLDLDDTNKVNINHKKRHAKESLKLNIIDDNNQIKDIKRDDSKHFILLTLKGASNEAINERSVKDKVNKRNDPSEKKEARNANEEELWNGPKQHVEVLTIPDLSSLFPQFTSTISPTTVDNIHSVAQNNSNRGKHGQKNFGRSVPIDSESAASDKNVNSYQEENENIPQIVNEMYAQVHNDSNNFKDFGIDLAARTKLNATEAVNRLEDQSEPTSAVEQKMLSTKFGLDGKPMVTTEPILGLMIFPQTSLNNVRSDAQFQVKDTDDMIHVRMQKQPRMSRRAEKLFNLKKLTTVGNNYKIVGSGLLGLDQIDIDDPPSVLDQKPRGPSYDYKIVKKKTIKKKQNLSGAKDKEKVSTDNTGDDIKKEQIDYYDIQNFDIGKYRNRLLMSVNEESGSVDKNKKSAKSLNADKRSVVEDSKKRNLAPENDYAENVNSISLEKRSEDDNDEEGEPFVGKKVTFKKKTNLNHYDNVEKDAKSVDEYNAQSDDDGKKKFRRIVEVNEPDDNHNNEGENNPTITASIAIHKDIHLIIGNPSEGYPENDNKEYTIIITPSSNTDSPDTNCPDINIPETNAQDNMNQPNMVKPEVNRTELFKPEVGLPEIFPNTQDNCQNIPTATACANQHKSNNGKSCSNNMRGYNNNVKKGANEKFDERTAETNVNSPGKNVNQEYNRELIDNAAFTHHPYSRHKGEPKKKLEPVKNTNDDYQNGHEVAQNKNTNTNAGGLKSNKYMSELTDNRRSKISDDDSFVPLQLQVEKLNRQVDPFNERLKFLPNSVNSFNDVVEPNLRKRSVEDPVWTKRRSWHQRRISRSHSSEKNAKENEKDAPRMIFGNAKTGDKSKKPIKEWMSINQPNKTSKCMMELNLAMKSPKGHKEKSDDAGQLHEAIRGKLASDIVKKVIEKLGENEKLYKRFGSGLHYSGCKEEVESLDSYKTNETAEDIKHTKETLKEIMSALHKIIFNQVHRKTCQTLTPNQAKYLEVLTKHSKDEVERELKNDDGYPLPLIRYVRKTTEAVEVDQGEFLYGNPEESKRSEVFQRIKLVRALIDKYDNMTTNSKTRVQPIQNYLKHHLQLLENMDEKLIAEEKETKKRVYASQHGNDDIDRSYRKIPYGNEVKDDDYSVDSKMINDQIRKLGLGNQYRVNVDDIIRKELTKQTIGPLEFMNHNKRDTSNARLNRYEKLVQAAEAIKKKRQHEEKLGRLFGNVKKRSHKRNADEFSDNQNLNRAKFEPPLVLSLDS